MSQINDDGAHITTHTLSDLTDGQVVIDSPIDSQNQIVITQQTPEGTVITHQSIDGAPSHQTTYIELINPDGSSGGLVEGVVLATGDSGQVMHQTSLLSGEQVQSIAFAGSGDNIIVANSGTNNCMEVAAPSFHQQAPPRPPPSAIVKKPIGKGPYQCEYCPKEYEKYGQLLRHVKVHDDDKEFKCTECDVSFIIEYNLKLHMAIHATGDELRCPECVDRKFIRVASLKSHIQMHVQEEIMMCQECGDEFSTKSSLDKHMREHRGEESEVFRTYNCKQCPQVFNKLSELREHQKHHYKVRSTLSHRTHRKMAERSDLPNKCKNCDKSFKKPSQLVRHNRIHTGERPFKCTQCDKAFNQKGALQAHMTKHTGDRPFVCQFCPQSFSQRGNLRSHVQRVHVHPTGDADVPVYQCELCSCVFRKMGSLNSHMSRTHCVPASPPHEKDGHSHDVIQHLLELSEQNLNSNTQQQAESDANMNSDILQQALVNSGLSGTTNTSTANIATKSSSGDSLSTMTFHDSATGISKKHIIRKANGIRWHQCTYCAKEFKKPSDLVRHYRIHTHEKPFKCSQCYRSFAVKSTLSAHLKTHSGVKDFKCDECNKMFATTGSLKIHLRLHTGAKPFDCPHCEKKFRTSGHRRTHIQAHFKEVTPKKAKRILRRQPGLKADMDLPDIPLQEPILITDTGLIQQPPRNSQMYYNLGDSGSTDRPYKCGYCQRAFKKSSHLKQHIRAHTGEKPYKCMKCQRSFVSSGVLKAHVRTHTGLKQYKCLICDSLFTTNGSLKRHMSTHSEVRPFMCPYCQKTFKTSVNCKKHMKTHKQELAIQALQQQASPDENQESQAALSTIQLQGPDVQHVHGISTLTSQQNQTTQQEQNPFQQIQQISQHSNQQDQNSILQDQLDKTLEQTLNQQVLGQQPLGQSILNINQGQFNIQTSQLQQTLDQLAGTSIASTNISNILQTGQQQQLQQQQAIVMTTQANDDGQRTFVCNYSNCDKSFKKSSHLKQHIRTHTGERPYTCNVCSKMFISTGVLKAHMKTHTGQKDFVCGVCSQSFTTNGSLTRHILVHNAAKPNQCEYCTETFRTETGVRRHMMSMHKDMMTNDDDDENEKKNARHRANVVEMTEEQTDELKQKTQSDELTVSEKLLIESAAEKDRISEVTAEAKEVEKLSRHANKCKLCPKSFKKPSDLVRHIRIHTGEKPYTCEQCNKSFTVKSTLDSHLKTHSGYQKVFTCHVCNSAFATKGSLKVHMRLHTGAKPFKCPHCMERFRTSGHRKSHIQTHFRTVDDVARRRKPPAPRSNNQSLNILGDLQNIILQSQQGTVAGTNQVINILEPSQILQSGQNIGWTLSVGQDQLSTIQTDSGYTAQLVPNLEGIQLQLTGAVNQLAGLDVSSLPALGQQTIHIDNNILQQLQNQGSVNLTLNPNQHGQQIEQSMQNIQIQSDNITTVNPDAIIQQQPQRDDSQLDSSEDEMSEKEDDEQNITIVHGESSDSIITSKTQKRHVPNILQSDTDRTHVCILCYKSFKRAVHLKEHMAMHSSQDGNKQEKHKAHSCTFCNKTFQKPSQLERHIRIHTGERPFTCSVCSKAFNQKNALQIHMKKHSGDRPFRCSYCDSTFAQKCNLKVHIKRAHHGDMVESMNIDGATHHIETSPQKSQVLSSETTAANEEVWYLQDM